MKRESACYTRCILPLPRAHARGFTSNGVIGVLLRFHQSTLKAPRRPAQFRFHRGLCETAKQALTQLPVRLPEIDRRESRTVRGSMAGDELEENNYALGCPFPSARKRCRPGLARRRP